MERIDRYITEKLKINKDIISNSVSNYTYDNLATYLAYIGEVNLDVEKIFDHDIYFKKRKEDRYKIKSIYTLSTNKSRIIFIGRSYYVEEEILPENLFDTFTEDEFNELCSWCEERCNEMKKHNS